MTININEVPTSIPTVSGNDLVAQIETARDQAQTAAANAQASALTCATWAVLSTLTGSTAGQGAEVLDSDGGSHTDPVVGGTVSNAGRYTWSTSPAGWERIGDTGLSGKVGPLDGFARLDATGFPQIVDANGAELLGFDADGQAILRLSPRVAVNLRGLLTGYLTQVDGSDYPSIRDAGGLEMLGFDADGKLRCAVSDALLTQIGAGLSRIGLGTTYDPVSAGLLPSAAAYLLGDSMSSDAVRSAIASETGKSVTRFALGGQTAFSMAVAVGAIPLTVTLTGNTIPVSGGVVVTARNTNLLNNGGTNTGTFRCTISGVPGLMTTDSGGVWTFTRDTAGSAVSVSAGVQAVLDAATGTASVPGTELIRDKTLVIRLGRNGPCETRGNRKTLTLDPLRTIVARLTPLDCRVLVVSPYNGRAQDHSSGADHEGAGTVAYAQRMQLNTEIAREFPRQWVDMRSWAVQNAIYDLGLTPTADDLADMAKDCIPRQLFSTGDNIHVNAAMQSAEGQFLGRIINANNW